LGVGGTDVSFKLYLVGEHGTAGWVFTVLSGVGAGGYASIGLDDYGVVPHKSEGLERLFVFVNVSAVELLKQLGRGRRGDNFREFCIGHLGVLF